MSGWVSVCLSCVCIFFFRGLILLHLHFKKKNNKCNNPATHKDSQPCTWVSMLYPVTQTCTQHYCSADAVEFHPFISFHRAGRGAQAGRVVMVGGGTVAKYDAVPTAVEVSAEFSQE